MAPNAQAARSEKKDAASTVELTPTPSNRDPVEQSLERAAEQVFLSPRVVDQRAFEDLTGTLQKVVREATVQGKSLHSTGEQVRGVTDQLRALMRELQQRTDSATKVLPLLEQQSKRVQELTTRVTHEAALSKAREVRDVVMKAVDEERAKAIASAKELVATEVREAVRAIVREEVERAQVGVAHAMDARAAEAERRTEAAATEVSEQLAALRADAARIVADARTELTTHQATPQGTPTRIAHPAPRDTANDEQKFQAALAAALDSITTSTDNALARFNAHADELRSLLSRGESMLRDLSERVEAASHATDRMADMHPIPQATTTLETPPAQNLHAAHLTHDLNQATMHAQQAGAWLLQLLGAADQVGRSLDSRVQAVVTPFHASTHRA